jgi:NAD+ synthase (glutamine-hydrolysing)
MSQLAVFESPSSHGFVRVALCTPRVDVAAPATNLQRTLALAHRAQERNVALMLFPELGLSAYSNEDLALQDALLDGVESAIGELLEASRTLSAILVIGAPLRSEARLFNCALVICRGELLGVIPKTYLPNYREFYEKRQFTSGAAALCASITVAGRNAPFGSDLIFESARWPDFALHVEICEDLWVPLPPSTHAALAGATVLANLSASNVTIGKADYRRLLCASQSAKCLAAYLYSAAGYGESTTDLAWDGHAILCENGEVLAESARFAYEDGIIVGDLDLERLRQERMRMTSFGDCAQQHRASLARLRRVRFELELPAAVAPLERRVARYPYVPADAESLNERCREAYSIQVQGLVRRMEASGTRKLVIGVSGGLDSTHALIVAAKAVDQLGLPRANVLGYSLPGFATSRRTRDDAIKLMQALGVSVQEIDIRPAAMQLLHDIGHPVAQGAAQYDVTFENVQAGQRAAHLFRLANLHGGLVVGTSDLSELALGYTTYGVGDHMSHYAVNASVPKTLIRHLVRWTAHSGQFDDTVARTLNHILETPASPELIPQADDTQQQAAEATVGPYDLQDFFLYYFSRYGFRPSKVAYLAHHAWSDRRHGDWPDSIPESERHEYDLATIKRWLEVFLRRFFELSQFKRSAMPNGPKVGSGGSLSPRSDWRAPSDARADAWLDELRRHVP